MGYLLSQYLLEAFSLLAIVMALDAATSAAVAALVVACLALLIALAQVLQQYFITGQLIRLCDSVVFGPLPGQGRRVWELSQFRFRVVYSIPQISLDTRLWPENPPHIRSYAIGQHELPPLRSTPKITGYDKTSEDWSLHTEEVARRRRWPVISLPTRSRPPHARHLSSTRSRVGEAAWVKLCRAVEMPCGSSMRLDLVEQDADRCPPDLVTAPMLVSMRDVIVMGLMAGMEVTECSFGRKSVSMQGHLGTITSSSHPVLGPLLHFTPRMNNDLSFGAFGIRKMDERGNIENRWMARTWDVCMVAHTYDHGDKRRTARRLDDRWIQIQGKRAYGEISRPGEHIPRHREPLRGERSRSSGSDKQRTTEEPPRPLSIHRDRSGNQTPRRYHQDGDWVITNPREEDLRPGPSSQQMPVPEVAKEGPTRSKAPETPTSGASAQPEPQPVSGPDRQPTVQEVEDEATASDASDQSVVMEKDYLVDPEMKERLQTAKTRQAQRSARVQDIENDKLLVEGSVNRGAMAPPTTQGMLLLTLHPHNEDQRERDGQPPEPTTEEEEAHRRETERQKLREQRDDERAERNKARFRAVLFKEVDLFWISQMNIFQGFWATPWAANDSMPLQSALVGAVTVILEALLGFLDQTSLIYTDQNYSSLSSCRQTTHFMFGGFATYPAYALNGRGGVIASGTYTGVRIPAFQTIIPAVELLYSYDWQVDARLRDPVRFCEEQNVELMRLDSWLSYVGRTREILDGRHKLLKQTPALVAEIFEDFILDFQNIDLSANEGGLQDIQSLVANVMDFLADEELSDAEQLYVLVALLRTVKACQCILAGPSTAQMRDILLMDVQVHLV